MGSCIVDRVPPHILWHWVIVYAFPVSPTQYNCPSSSEQFFFHGDVHFDEEIILKTRISSLVKFKMHFNLLYSARDRIEKGAQKKESNASYLLTAVCFVLKWLPAKSLPYMSLLDLIDKITTASGQPLLRF